MLFNQKNKYEDSYNEVLETLKYKMNALKCDQNSLKRTLEEMTATIAALENKITDHLENYSKHYNDCDDDCCNDCEPIKGDCDCHCCDDYDEDDTLYREGLCDEALVTYPGVVIDAELDIDGEPYLSDADYELIKDIANGKEKVDIVIITENVFQFIVENLRADVLPRMVYATKSFHVVPNSRSAAFLIESLQNALFNLD